MWCNRFYRIIARSHVDGCWHERGQVLRWEEMRVHNTLEGLLQEGLALVDDQAPQGHRLFWFPCLDGGGQASVAA